MKTNVNTTGAGSAHSENLAAAIATARHAVSEYYESNTTTGICFQEMRALFDSIRQAARENDQVERLANIGSYLADHWSSSVSNRGAEHAEKLGNELESFIQKSGV